jgi:hypothetical protein
VKPMTSSYCVGHASMSQGTVILMETLPQPRPACRETNDRQPCKVSKCHNPCRETAPRASSPWEAPDNLIAMWDCACIPLCRLSLTLTLTLDFITLIVHLNLKTNPEPSSP